MYIFRKSFYLRTRPVCIFVVKSIKTKIRKDAKKHTDDEEMDDDYPNGCSSGGLL